MLDASLSLEDLTEAFLQVFRRRRRVGTNGATGGCRELPDAVQLLQCRRVGHHMPQKLVGRGRVQFAVGKGRQVATQRMGVDRFHQSFGTAGTRGRSVAGLR